MIDGALLPDKREERGEDAWPSAEQGRNERPHAEQGVMKGPRHVPTRGWITCADFEGLLRLPVAIGPDLHPDCEPVSKGTGMCAGGTTTANSDSREGV
jgi:hypothetical protein